ncbi:unnamed protein product, partial [Owenia fusiformis]
SKFTVKPVLTQDSITHLPVPRSTIGSVMATTNTFARTSQIHKQYTTSSIQPTPLITTEISEITNSPSLPQATTDSQTDLISTSTYYVNTLPASTTSVTDISEPQTIHHYFITLTIGSLLCVGILLYLTYKIYQKCNTRSIEQDTSVLYSSNGHMEI